MIVTISNHRALKSFAILKHHEKGGGRGEVSSGIEESEVRVSNLEPIVRSYRQFLAPMERGPSKQSKGDEEKHNYYVNIGYAIQTLREEFLDIFYRELRFDIYRFELNFLFNYCVLWTNNPFGFRESDRKT